MPKINKGERNKRGSGARMKKEYVKPVIESEEFVANEYVALCWTGYCHERHYLLGIGNIDVTEDVHNVGSSGITSTIRADEQPDNTEAYQDSVIFGGFGRYHHVYQYERDKNNVS